MVKKLTEIELEKGLNNVKSEDQSQYSDYFQLDIPKTVNNLSIQNSKIEFAYLDDNNLLIHQRRLSYRSGDINDGINSR